MTHLITTVIHEHNWSRCKKHLIIQCLCQLSGYHQNDMCIIPGHKLIREQVWVTPAAPSQPPFSVTRHKATLLSTQSELCHSVLSVQSLKSADQRLGGRHYWPLAGTRLPPPCSPRQEGSNSFQTKWRDLKFVVKHEHAIKILCKQSPYTTSTLLK